MKKIVCISALLYASLLYGQKLSLTLSDKFKLPEGGLAVRSGDSYYCMDIDRSGAQFAPTAKLSKVAHAIRLYKYDTAMNELSDVKLESGKKAFGPFSSQILNFYNKVLLFYFKYNEDTVKLFMSQVDPQQKLMDTALVFTIWQKDELLMLGSAHGLNILYTIASPDGTKLLLAFGNAREIHSCILNEGLKISATSVLPVPGKKFDLEDVIVDNTGNKYFAYEAEEDKKPRRGILVENHSGSHLFQAFDMAGETYKVKRLNFGSSREKSKVYVYADYYGIDMMEGIVMAGVDGENLKINTPLLFPYTNELKEKLRDISFTSKSKGLHTVYETQFNLVENEEGTIALFGQPSYSEFKPPDMFSKRSVSYDVYHAGPILGAFIKGGQVNFIVIPRKDIAANRAQSTIIAHKKEFICIYSDMEKNLVEEKEKDVNHYGRMVFAANAYNGNGTMISQKRLAPFPRESFYYHFTHMQKIAEGKYLVSVSETTAGMTRYRSNMIHWLNLRIE